MKATLVHGHPGMIDHTPSTDVAAGDIIAYGDGVLIAHLDIEADRLGAVADGAGVYDIVKPGGDGLSFGKSDDVYWDPTANDGDGEVTDDPEDNKYVGKAVAAALDADTTVRVRHLQPTPEAVTGT